MTSLDPTFSETQVRAEPESRERESNEQIRVSNGQVYLAGVLCAWIASAMGLTILYMAAMLIDHSLGTGWF